MSTSTTAPTRAPLLARPHRALVLGIVGLVALTAFEAVAVATAMPVVARDLGGLHLYALAFAAPLAASIVGVVAGGSSSDARGPRRPLLLGLVLFVAGLLLSGLAPSMEVFTAGRAVQGLGSGMLVVALYVVVARAFPAGLQPRVFAAMAAAWVLPAMVGPAVSGLVAEHLGWRWVFLATPLLAAAAVVPVAGRLPGDTPGRAAGDARTRLAFSAALALGAGALHLAGERGGTSGALLAAASLALVVAGAPRLLPAGTVLARRGLPAVVALRGLVFAAFTGAEVFLPLLLTARRELPVAVAGLVLTAGALGWSAGSWWQGRREVPPDAEALRAERAGLLRLGLGMQALGIAVAAAALLPAVPVAVALAGWLVAGFGTGLAYPVTSLLVLGMSPEGEQGRNSSALQISDALVATVVLAASGSVLGALGAQDPLSYAAGFAVAGGAALVGALLAGRAR
ncbi:MFS transporter [Kineococcus sp. NUM-3379]